MTNKMKDYNGIDADPESEIIVSAGSTGAFYCACLAYVLADVSRLPGSTSKDKAMYILEKTGVASVPKVLYAVGYV